MKINLSVDSVRESLKTASSIREALYFLGYRDSSAYYAALKKFCENNKLEYKALGVKKPKTVIPTEIWLVENSPVKGTVLKNRLLREGYFQYKCYGDSCTVRETWLGKPITLHLEHRNGIHNDNRLENLTLLCPNCHTQTPTYAVAKTHPEPKDREACPCGSAKSELATMCSVCYTEQVKNTSDEKYPPKEELRLLIDKYGYRGTGRLFGVSDNAIRRRINSR